MHLQIRKAVSQRRTMQTTILAVYWEDQTVKSRNEILASIVFNTLRIHSEHSHMNNVEASTLV